MKWKKYTRLPDHALRSRACSFIRLEMICSWLSKTEKPPMQHAKRNFNKKKTRWIESERMSNTTTTTKKKKWRWNANEHESAAVYSCRSIESLWLLFHLKIYSRASYDCSYFKVVFVVVSAQYFILVCFYFCL